MSFKIAEYEFEAAQALRRSHCDRKHDERHACVGTVTIKKGEVCLDCSLCGKGQMIPGFRAAIAEKLQKIFLAAGIDWSSLDMDAKVAAIRRYEETYNEVNH